MARGFLKLCGAALIFVAGWKAKGKADDMFGVPKPATVLEKLSQFWDGVSAGGATEKQKPRTVQQTEEWLRREADQIRAELQRDLREGQRQLIAALTEEVKRSRPEDYQRDGNYWRPPSRTS